MVPRESVYEFMLTIDDYLNLMLYNHSINKEIQKNNKTNRILTACVFFILGIYLIFKREETIAGFLGLFCTYIGIFSLFGSRKQKNQTKEKFILYIHENYKARLNIPVKLWITDEFLCMQDDLSDLKIKIQNINAVDEINQDLFIRYYTCEFVIIPKSMENYERFKQALQLAINTDIPWTLDPSWKW